MYVAIRGDPSDLHGKTFYKTSFLSLSLSLSLFKSKTIYIYKVSHSITVLQKSYKLVRQENEKMSKYLNLGFRKARREMEYPFTVTFRCNEETSRQLASIKEYLRDSFEPPLNTSDVIRTAIQMGNAFACIQTAQKEQKEEVQKARRKSAAPAESMTGTLGIIPKEIKE